MTDKQTYHQWGHVPDDIKTKTQWRDAGRALTDTAEPTAIYSRHGKTYDLYHIYATRPIDEKRRKAAQKATKTRQEKLLNNINKLEITVPRYDLPTLRQTACDHYNSHWTNSRDYKRAAPDDDQDFLDRITVNFLRHELSCYEAQLVEITGKVGKQVGYEQLKQRVLNAIAETYPDLSDECDRQALAINIKN